MTVNINAMDLITGLHTSRSPAFQGKRTNDNTLRHLVNGLNIAGWIPLVGTIAGIARLIFTAIMHKNDQKKNHGEIDPEAKAFYTAMIMRGVIETLSLGFLLVAQDIIFTVGRNIAYPQLIENNYQTQTYSSTQTSSAYPMKGYSEKAPESEWYAAESSKAYWQ